MIAQKLVFDIFIRQSPISKLRVYLCCYLTYKVVVWNLCYLRCFLYMAFVKFRWHSRASRSDRWNLGDISNRFRSSPYSAYNIYIIWTLYHPNGTSIGQLARVHKNSILHFKKSQTNNFFPNFLSLCISKTNFQKSSLCSILLLLMFWHNSVIYSLHSSTELPFFPLKIKDSFSLFITISNSSKVETVWWLHTTEYGEILLTCWQVSWPNLAVLAYLSFLCLKSALYPFLMDRIKRDFGES